MKKLINDPRDVVREMLEGFTALTPGWLLLGDENVLIRAGLPTPADRSVAILSGGGSGHEPAHAGYVGPGMLTPRFRAMFSRRHRRTRSTRRSLPALGRPAPCWW